MEDGRNRSYSPPGRRWGRIAALISGIAVVAGAIFAVILASPAESGPKAYFRACVEAEGGVVLDSMTIRIDRAGRHIIGGGIGNIDPDLVSRCLDAIPHDADK
ncbi:hypothetical protein BMS3Bbin02_01356 [bacterium BMS3Bbin02]|nr:hypothetical protein BMS3Bbin02_01356 [bacterium BMS3Bbin02]